MISIISLLDVLNLSVLVTRIAMVTLTYKGLARESARFSARSARFVFPELNVAEELRGSVRRLARD